MYYCWQNRETPIAISYGLGIFAVTFYTFGYAMQLVSNTISEMMFWIHIQYVGIPLGPYLWLIMIVQYTDNQRLLTKRNVLLLTIGPLCSYVAHFTNNWHELFYKSMALNHSQGFPLIDLDRGPLFYMHIAYTYSYYIVGTTLLVYTLMKLPKERKKQMLIMIIGSLTIFLFPLIHSLQLLPVPIDISPFGLTLATMFYLWGIHQFNVLRLSPLAMKKVFESISDAVMIFDLDNVLKSYNKAAIPLFEHSPQKKIVGRQAQQILAHSPALLQLLVQGLLDNPMKRQTLQINEQHYNVHISYINGQSNKPVGKLLILHDITETIRYEQSLLEQTQKFEYLAHHDMLTGIYNRTYFEKEVQRRLAIAATQNSALMLCDLNFFKEINDIHGHITGDKVLVFTANCWKEHLPNPHLLARLGGDEFVMFFEEIHSKEQFLQQIEDVRRVFHQNTYKDSNVEIEIVPSIGIAFVEEEGTDYEMLYQICDVRMYDDKKYVKQQYKAVEEYSI